MMAVVGVTIADVRIVPVESAENTVAERMPDADVIFPTVAIVQQADVLQILAMIRCNADRDVDQVKC